MTDLSRPWPLGLGGKSWWIPVLGAVVLLGVALAFDRQLSLGAQALPQQVRDVLAQITPYGESGWILIPAAALFVLTALVALFVRWRLMRTMLWQFTALYAFIFLGVGLPGLITTLVKRFIGRGRPVHFGDTGLFGLHWNWADWSYESFPSGHATTAFALATVLGMISPRWFYPALAGAALIGLSRVTLGVHYPSDVIAGAIVGLVGAYAVRGIFARRGWVFIRDAQGRIMSRPMASLARYVALKRRGSGPAPTPDRP